MNQNLVKVIDTTVEGDFRDAVAVWQKFLDLVNDLPGLRVLGSLKHDFPGGGFSGLILLGESHAAIHAWPELGLAWAELSTCGDPAALGLFSASAHVLGK